MFFSEKVKFLKEMLAELGIENAEGEPSKTIERKAAKNHVAAVTTIPMLTKKQQDELYSMNKLLSITNIETLNASVIRY